MVNGMEIDDNNKVVNENILVKYSNSMIVKYKILMEYGSLFFIVLWLLPYRNTTNYLKVQSTFA